MATTTKKKGKGDATKQANVPDIISGVNIDVKGHDEYKRYAVATIEDRFVEGSLDGVKPVLRRSLWAAYGLGLHPRSSPKKAARLVGETLGKYHPHGDSACYGAIVTAANSPLPTIQGIGNFGTMIDPTPAGMRYPELRLSKYAELCFFDRFYMPTMQLIPNYDGSEEEPLNLPVMLPNALLNGNFGMGPGVSTRTPAFTLKSVIKTLQKVITAGGVATPELCVGLQPTSEHGGVVKTLDKAIRSELRDFYKSGTGAMTFYSTATAPDAQNTVRFYRFAPLPDVLDKKLNAIAAITGVKKVDDDSEDSDPFRAAFRVQLQPNLRGTERVKALAAVHQIFSVKQYLNVQVSDRVMNEKGEVSINLRSTNVPTLINDWLRYRVATEKAACQYWINKREERIAYLNLLIHAINHLPVIIKSLEVEDSHAYLAKHLKISREQADSILQLRVIQLKKLEIKRLQADIKALELEVKGFRLRIKKPFEYIAKHLDHLWAELKDEAGRQEFFVEEKV